MPTDTPLLILIAGPYRSGTGDDPAKLAANVRSQMEAAVILFRRGHIPLSGETLCPPMVEAAGSTQIGDAIFDEIFHPFAERLLPRCDAVLRWGGPSQGADAMVHLAHQQGLQVFHDIDAIPQVAA